MNRVVEKRHHFSKIQQQQQQKQQQHHHHASKLINTTGTNTTTTTTIPTSTTAIVATPACRRCFGMNLAVMVLIFFSVSSLYSSSKQQQIQSKVVVSSPSSSSSSSSRTSPPIQPIDCTTLPMDTDPHYWIYNFTTTTTTSTTNDLNTPVVLPTVIVNRPWWFGRNSIYYTTENDIFFKYLFEETLENEIFIDVGANVGQLTIPGVIGQNHQHDQHQQHYYRGRTTYAFDPLQYDMIKVCSGIQETINRNYYSPPPPATAATTTPPTSSHPQIPNFYLYHCLVGNVIQNDMNISRPDDTFGKFEQASMASNTIGVARKPTTLVTETVPMITLDSIFSSSDEPIGLIKIDVQGFELMVIEGMTEILNRKRGYPHIIYYEENKRVTTLAGYTKLGTIQTVLETTYKYKCQQVTTNDIACIKPRRTL